MTIAKKVYIDTQDGLPTLWDNPAAGRIEMLAVMDGDDVLAIMPRATLNAAGNELCFTVPEDFRTAWVPFSNVERG